MSELSRRGSVLIIGGGATGVMLAAHLLDSDNPSLRVTLIEKRQAFGEGVAYSSSLPDHLLNVSDRAMSALAADPGHFHRWVRDDGHTEGDVPFYAPRALYARYLGDLLDGLVEREPVRLRLVREEAISLKPSSAGVEITLANGASLVGHAAVLATGHDEMPSPAIAHARRPDFPVELPSPDARVLILGTGLGMIDAYLALEAQGHTGEIVAVSRRGLLPSPHKQAKPIRLDSADIPLGTDLSYFVRWFRQLLDETVERGGDWRDVVDGLRPFHQSIWQSWPAGAKRRFLEHTKAWWDVHRHRMAPQIHDRVASAVASGRLAPLAGRVVDVRQARKGYTVTIEHRHTRRTQTIAAAAILDCTGIVKDMSEGSVRIVRSLFDEGLARPDALRIGLDVGTDCALLDNEGKPSSTLFAAGPLTRGTFFEIDAVPEIRAQCARLAALLAGRAPAAG